MQSTVTNVYKCRLLASEQWEIITQMNRSGSLGTSSSNNNNDKQQKNVQRSAEEHKSWLNINIIATYSIWRAPQRSAESK